MHRANAKPARPRRHGDGAPLACTPDECAAGGRTPHYRVRGGRLVKG